MLHEGSFDSFFTSDFLKGIRSRMNVSFQKAVAVYKHLEGSRSVKHPAAMGELAVCYEGTNLFPSWAPVERTLLAFGAGIFQMAESRAARGNRGFSQPRSIFLVPDSPRDLFPLLIRLASHIFSSKPKKRQALGLINCLLQRSDLLGIFTCRSSLLAQVPVGVFFFNL